MSKLEVEYFVTCLRTLVTLELFAAATGDVEEFESIGVELARVDVIEDGYDTDSEEVLKPPQF